MMSPVISRYVSGGFGGKAYVWPHTLLGAAIVAAWPGHGAPRAHSSVTRAQMYSMARPSTGHHSDDHPGRRQDRQA